MYMFSHSSCVPLFATPWTIAHQAPLSTGFPRQEYPSSRGSSPPRDQTHISCISCIAVGFFSAEPPRKPYIYLFIHTHTCTNGCVYIHVRSSLKTLALGLPRGSVAKNLPANARDMGFFPELGNPTCGRASKPKCQNY